MDIKIVEQIKALTKKVKELQKNMNAQILEFEAENRLDCLLTIENGKLKIGVAVDIDTIPSNPC